MVDTIHIDGLDLADTITIHGTDQDETVTVTPNSVDVVGETYEIHITNVETITVNAGTGTDRATSTTVREMTSW